MFLSILLHGKVAAYSPLEIGNGWRGWRLTQLCSCCGSRRVDAPLDGFVRDGRAATTAETTCYDPGSWADAVLGDILDKSLGDGDARGRRFPN